MAFQKKTWLARLGQGLNKFIFNGGSKVTLDSSPDVVTQEGTPLSADNMNDLEQRIEDEFTNVNGAITSLLTPTTIWSGDIHATGGAYTVSEAITNFMALQFVFNVIPSRSPSYDVQADQSLILPFVGRYDLSSVTGGVSAFGIEFTSTTDFTVYTYSKATSYDAGLVRIIGLFRLPN